MWFFGLIVVLLIGAVAVVASGRWGAMSTAYDDRPDMTVPARQALTSTDIESARFAVGVRGYRMDEVDTLLERVAKEVAERDRRIADLERAVAPIVEAPDGHGFTSRPYDPAEFEDTGAQPTIMVGGNFPDTPTQPEPAPSPVGESGQADSTQAVPTDRPTAGDAGSGAAPGTADAAAAGTAGAGTAGGADESRGTASAPDLEDAGDADDEPETSELPAASRAAADEYERLQAEARAVLEAQSQPVSPRRAPAPHQPSPTQQPQQQPPQTPEQQPPVQQTPEQQTPVQQTPVQQTPVQQTRDQQTRDQQTRDQQTRDQQASDQEKQVPEQQAFDQPSGEPGQNRSHTESAPLTPAQRYDQLVQNQRPAEPPAPQQPTESAHAEPSASTHWTSQPAPQQQEQAGEPKPTEQTRQTPPQDPLQGRPTSEQAGQAEDSANGAAGDGDEEGWRFWPPADQAGEGAYQRPT